MNQRIKLWISPEKGNPSITLFLLPGYNPRPAVLIIPGGGYGCVCDQSEGTPVALKFNEMGYHAFVLDYRVAPHSFPAPLEDAVRAVKIIRGNARKWKIIPDRIASCGFSAGAHLAGALGTLTDMVNADAGDRFDVESGVVDAMILSYGVLVYAPWSHQSSWDNLSGNDPVSAAKLSLEKNISGKTPPAFVWATFKDQVVDYRNSVVFAQAMAEKNRPCELHLYPWGNHGMLLGLDTLDVSSWTSDAKHFLDAQWEMRSDPDMVKPRYTNAYQIKSELRDGLTYPKR